MVPFIFLIVVEGSSVALRKVKVICEFFGFKIGIFDVMVSLPFAVYE